MIQGLEGVGEVVTGGLIARALESGAGEARGDGETCLNCGTALTGSYCHLCGQKGHVHRTLGAFWHDVAHSVLHFDGKIWRTLPLLAWQPGELTRRYVEGERARFVSPMALFLFSVFLMFAVISTIGGPFHVDSEEEVRAELVNDLAKEFSETQDTVQKLEIERQEALQRGRPNEAIDITMTSLREQQRTLQENRLKTAAGEEVTTDEPVAANSRINLQTGWPPLDAAIERANENPSLLIYKIQTNAYKFSWALIPISVPFVWLMFLHRRRYRQYRAYDHTVFVTYSIAFMSLGFIALSLLRPLGIGDTLPALAIAFIPPIHMYRQLRGAYRLSRWSALWRTFLLLNFAFVAAGLFLILLVALGVMG